MFLIEFELKFLCFDLMCIAKLLGFDILKSVTQEVTCKDHQIQIKEQVKLMENTVNSFHVLLEDVKISKI